MLFFISKNEIHSVLVSFIDRTRITKQRQNDWSFKDGLYTRYNIQQQPFIKELEFHVYDGKENLIKCLGLGGRL